MSKAQQKRLELATASQNRIVNLEYPVYPKVKGMYADQPWVQPGRYEVMRVFDENRIIIRLTQRNITLIDKRLTTDVT